MRSLNGVAVVAAWGALAVGGMAVAQDADCNVNGIPDAAEIAAGLADDCNGNGIPDPCEYAGTSTEGETGPFGDEHPLVVTIADAGHAVSDLRLSIAVRADLDAINEAVQAKVGNTVVATLWITSGQACPEQPQVQTVVVPMATVNAAIDGSGGTLVVTVQSVGPVSVKECPGSFALVTMDYVSNIAPPDCLGTGAWDACDIAADAALDCDGNGLIDLCEMAGDPRLDCDDSGQLDVCEIASIPALDCDLNGTLDTCDLASDAPSFDCDGNGLIDACEIATDPGLDCTGNGILNACELASASAGIPCDPDCDGDGVHDVCQMNADPSLDKNGDGLLDACQYARGDLTLDGVIDGADLAYMLGLWDSKNPPLGDLNADGLVDGADLAQLLGQWGVDLLQPECWATVLEADPDPTVVTELEWRDRIIATGLPWRVRDNASQVEMLLVPPGTFMMGCSPSDQINCEGDESPIHEVTITRAFYLGRYEVTQAQWTAVMGSNPSAFQDGADSGSRPVEQIYWFAARSFVEASGFRLPTEAEWEYACRAGTSTAYNNGSDDDDTLADLGWTVNNAGGQTHVVGQKQANTIGFHDMHGNVWEWVNDWYSSTYYAESPQVDPQGPDLVDGGRVLRGGSWNQGDCRSSGRDSRNPNSGWNYGFFGFRVARTP